jgi:hypothetical protein
VTFEKTTNLSDLFKSHFVYKQMPVSELFLYGFDTPKTQGCYMEFNGNKNTQPQLCRIGQDQASPPVYFIFGDSSSRVMANVFNELKAPGMFAPFS